MRVLVGRVRNGGSGHVDFRGEEERGGDVTQRMSYFFLLHHSLKKEQTDDDPFEVMHQKLQNMNARQIFSASIKILFFREIVSPRRRFGSDCGIGSPSAFSREMRREEREFPSFLPVVAWEEEGARRGCCRISSVGGSGVGRSVRQDIQKKGKRRTNTKRAVKRGQRAEASQSKRETVSLKISLLSIDISVWNRE